MGEEEVSVLLVVCCAELEVCGLRAAFTAYTAACTLFLAYDGLNLQLAELHVCAKAEEAAHAWNEADVTGEGDVTGFDELDDFIFLAVVFEFEVLGVVVEGGLGVIVQVHVDFVAHLTIEAEVNLFIEIEAYGFAARGSKGRIVDLL